MDKQSGASLAVLQAYNFDADRYKVLFSEDSSALVDVAQMMAAIIANTEKLQNTLANNDLLESQFHLVNDAVVFLSVDQTVTKINKTAEIMLRREATDVVGKQISELLGKKNNHLLQAITEVIRSKPFVTLDDTTIEVVMSGKNPNESGQTVKIDINMQASKLVDTNKKAIGFCVILQPLNK